MPLPPKTTTHFSDLIQVVSDLRGPNGCPWDKEQDHQSLARYTIEECYELVDALNENNNDDIKDELGDVLLQVVLHAQIAKDENNFNINDIIQSITEKMIRRHPHVFSDVKADTTDEVWKNWDEIKKQEKNNKNKLPSDSFQLPKHLDALIKSIKIGEKSRKLNFDWKKPSEVLLKVDEELAEVKEAISSNNKQEIEEELGDLLFAVCQLARHLKVDPQQSLQKANSKFEKRFFKMKNLIESEGLDQLKLDNNKLETYWQKIKKS